MNGYKAKAVSYTTLDDVDQLAPGAHFAVTWAFRNAGDVAWNDGTSLVYTDEAHPDTYDHPHSALGAPVAQALADLGAPATVDPGADVHLTVTFVAPDEPGVYLTAWQLQAPDGVRFGPVRSVRIIVVAAEKALEPFAYRQSSPFFNSFRQYNAMPVGHAFSGNWTLENTGLDAWSGDFRVVFVADATANTAQALGHRLGFPGSRSLRELTGREHVAPGESVRIRLDLTAPAEPGVYAFHWQLQTADGTPFGGTRWLKIGAVAPTQPSPPDPVTTLPDPPAPQVTFFTGIHGPADDYVWHDGAFQSMMRRLDMPVLFWSKGDNVKYADFGDPARNAVRLYWNPRQVTADEAYVEIRDDQLRHWWQRGYRRFIFFNEPQFGIEIAKIEEGMGIAWHSKAQFARFLAQCLRRARADYPDIQLFTTPMSSNEAFDPWGWRAAMWAQVQGVVDGWCMHAYSGNNANAEAAAENIAQQVRELQRRFQLSIPVIVSEASVNRGNDAAQKARVAHVLHRKLTRVRGVEGVFWYAADWNPDYDTHHEGWFRNGIAEAYLRQRG